MDCDVVVLPADFVELAGELLLLAVGLIIIHSKKLYRRCEWKVIMWGRRLVERVDLGGMRGSDVNIKIS